MAQLEIQAVLHKYTSLISLSEHHDFIRAYTNTQPCLKYCSSSSNQCFFLRETGSFMYDCLYHFFPEQESNGKLHFLFYKNCHLKLALKQVSSNKAESRGDNTWTYTV